MPLPPHLLSIQRVSQSVHTNLCFPLSLRRLISQTPQRLHACGVDRLYRANKVELGGQRVQHSFLLCWGGGWWESREEEKVVELLRAYLRGLEGRILGGEKRSNGPGRFREQGVYIDVASGGICFPF